MIVVRCNDCGWIGSESELFKLRLCPLCKITTLLSEPDNGSPFDDNELEILWGIFGDVWINDFDEIEEEFLGFPVGTDRFEIWHWFDEHYSGGVAKLLGVM